MKTDELIKVLSEHKGKDIEFIFTEMDDTDWGLNVRVFKDIRVCDIGYSSKVIRLSGVE